MIKPADKRALVNWDVFVDNMNRAAPVDLTETPLQKAARISALEAYPEHWFQYYFSKFYTAEPAPFHLRSTQRVLNNPEWFEARPWSRELSKSGRTMMEVLYLAMTGKKRNIILASNNSSNAIRLLLPYKTILEKNSRLINDYGVQQSIGNWKADEFITRNGVAFRALGAGESPRGTRNDEIRPDCIIVDDFDTDEQCRNPELVEQAYDWLERALIPTRSISVPLLVIFNGNIIAEDCCMLRAMAVADFYEIVNIRDENGKSTWPNKNTEAYIDTALRFLSYKAIQGEYYNNPITEGKVFKEIHFKAIRPLKEYRFLVSYTDPSYKSGRKNDFKATCLMGKWKDEYHVIRQYCQQTTTANMLAWHYEIMSLVNGAVPLYMLIEWPWIDDSLKLEIAKANKHFKRSLPLTPDPRKKPEKFYRIESSLEPINRNGKLYFNQAIKDTPDMKACEAQFKALSQTSRAHDDGPDSVEGAKATIDSKTISNTGGMQVLPPIKNSKRV
ncbi:hypothetical protein [Mucilaginibacter rubeus]|uniref:Terminase large subunit gp17-like C-terminal domain-containing protein n=1 Tax=Mucilaginibacter rubeus TaxID=2027860 RepID=A0A5C1I9P0_9SPHI|nr:hypothetical protein [Mucilaginibacter rubeus]QEM13471.1 hypothetical protein DEO27_026825 [Mucilaginibacter rubeus]